MGPGPRLPRRNAHDVDDRSTCPVRSLVHRQLEYSAGSRNPVANSYGSTASAQRLLGRSQRREPSCASSLAQQLVTPAAEPSEPPLRCETPRSDGRISWQQPTNAAACHVPTKFRKFADYDTSAAHVDICASVCRWERRATRLFRLTQP